MAPARVTKTAAVTQNDRLEAIAAAPGLEELAAVLQRHDPRSMPSDHHVGLVVILGARWAARSATEATATLADPMTWMRMRRAAMGVGRSLPAAPPTYEKLRRFRQAVEQHAAPGRGMGDFLDELKAAFTRSATEVAIRIGLLGDTPRDLDDPSLLNVVVGDGVTFRPASRAQVVDGVGVRTRATSPDRVREVETHFGKPASERAALGLPVAVASVRGGDWMSRVVLSFEEIRKGNEIGAAEIAFDRLLNTAGDRVHFIAYDALASTGEFCARLLHRNVIPVTPMRAAASDDDTTTAKVGGRLIGKKQVQTRFLDRTSHTDAFGRCHHDVYAVDGALRIVPIGEAPDRTSPTATRIGMDKAGLFPDDAPQWEGHYTYTCDGTTHEYVIELTGTHKTAAGTTSRTANVLRPIPESDPRFAAIYDRREDAESLFSHIKRLMGLNDLAGSFKPDHFTLDMLGAALLINALAARVHRDQPLAPWHASHLRSRAS